MRRLPRPSRGDGDQWCLLYFLHPGPVSPWRLRKWSKDSLTPTVPQMRDIYSIALSLLRRREVEREKKGRSGKARRTPEPPAVKTGSEQWTVGKASPLTQQPGWIIHLLSALPSLFLLLYLVFL